MVRSFRKVVGKGHRRNTGGKEDQAGDTETNLDQKLCNLVLLRLPDS